MSSKITILVLSIYLLASAYSSEAQEPAKIARIGVLCQGNCESPLYNALWEGLRRLGYIEGHNILIEKRDMEGRQERLPDFVADLVRLKVDVILAAGSLELSQAVKRVTKTTPTVFVTAEDPVIAGLVASFARPGGNITGLTGLNTDLDGKRLALLKETIPRAKRVAVLHNPSDPTSAAIWRVMERTGRSLNVLIQRLEIREPDDFDLAIGTTTKPPAEALIVLGFPLFYYYQLRIAKLATKRRLPTVSAWKQLTEAGGLMSYGANIPDMFRRAASYIDRILKGAKPGDLPVERPMRAEMIINLKTANEIGLTIPPEVLQQADKVIR
jgi:putative tryptophan/tyrosine transport system substrate-binding protein